MTGKHRFRILAVDTHGKCVIKNEQQLLYATAAHGDLWENCEIKTSPPHLSAKGCSLTSQVIKPDEDLKDVFLRAFEIELSGSYDTVESRRLTLLRYYKLQQFDLIYILHDDVSDHIACKLYPLLYKVENALRGYLLRFMVTRLGPGWWDVTAKAELGGKVTQRKNNEVQFTDADVKAYLVDFGDLGKLVYSHSSGFSTKEDIIRKISDLDETPEAIRALKEQLQSNYQKFFRETFKEKGFQEKWEGFEKLRHKIAHTSLFTAADLSSGENLSTDLCAIIQAAESGAPSLTLPTEEKEAIRESFILRSNPWAVITESDFLEELRLQEAYFASKAGFVGLLHFVKFHLGPKGYDFASTFALADALNARGAVELYDVPGTTSSYPTRAIRLIQKTAERIRIDRESEAIHDLIL